MDITTICFNVTNVSQEQDKIDETFVAQSEADATVAAWCKLYLLHLSND